MMYPYTRRVISNVGLRFCSFAPHEGAYVFIYSLFDGPLNWFGNGNMPRLNARVCLLSKAM